MEHDAGSRDVLTYIPRIASIFGYDREWLAFGGPLVTGAQGTGADDTTTDTGPVNNRYLPEFSEESPFAVAA
jgi:hypothetical protein